MKNNKLDKIFLPNQLTKQLIKIGFNEPCLSISGNNDNQDYYGYTTFFVERKEEQKTSLFSKFKAAFNLQKEIPQPQIINPVPTPTYDQVVNWFLDEYNLWIEINMGKDENSVWFDWSIHNAKTVSDYEQDYEEISESDEGLSSRETALCQAIEYAIKYVDALKKNIEVN